MSNYFDNTIRPAYGQPFQCSICRLVIPDEPCHVAGIWIDGRIRWIPACGHVPILGAQIRLGTQECCYRYLAAHPEEQIGVRYAMLGVDV